MTLPGPTTATATAPSLHSVRTAITPLSGGPFGAAVTAHHYTFVTTGNAVALLRNGSGLAPALVRTIAAPGAGKGLAITPDGQHVVAAAGSGAVVINVNEAIAGSANPVTETLTSPDGAGAVEVLLSGDFAFVTLQTSGQLAVFNLKTAHFVGYVPLAAQPVGMASDGTWLYVVSLAGTLAVLNLHTAETHPSRAVVRVAKAGAQPARAMLGDHNTVVWVTARASNALLAFSAAKLRTDPAHALLAKVMVGETPLGETFVDGGNRILVADSNLNLIKGKPFNVAVVSVAAAMSGKKALLGYIPVGAVPRQFAVEPGGKVALVTVQNAHQLEAIDVGGLP